VWHQRQGRDSERDQKGAEREGRERSDIGHDGLMEDVQA
jgi:hypothetical protein